MEDRKSLKRNIVLNLAKTIMSLIFPLITFPYVSRVLLPEGLGRINFAQSIVSYFSLIAALGISTYAIREISKRKDNQNELNGYFTELFLINMISTIVAYVLLFGVLFFVPQLNCYRLLIVVLSISILFSTIGVEWLYTGFEDFFYITIRSFIFQCVSVVLMFTFVRSECDFLKYALIIVFSNVGSNIFNFFHCRKYVHFTKINIKNCRKHLRPIFVIFFTGVANSIYTMLDTSMLGFVSGDLEVGYYSAATKINRIVLSVLLSIGPVMLPRLAYLKSNNKEMEYKELLNKSLSLMLMLGCPCVVGLEILSKPIILLFSGDQYLPALATMRILNPIIFIVCFGNFFGVQVFLPNNKEKLNLFIICIASFVNLILNIILIPKYASAGAAVASLIAETVVSIVSFMFGMFFIDVKKVVISCLRYLGSSFVMGIGVYFIQSIIGNIVLKLFFSVISGVVIYFSLLLLQRDVIVIENVKKVLKRN